MFLEQSFVGMQEVFLTPPFQNTPMKDYEGSIVSAYTMGVLQQLNGRNYDNPISMLRQEVKYDPQRSAHADLRLNLKNLDLVTSETKEYGFYSDNWLEAKYFRSTTTNKTCNVFDVMVDLMRLILLPQEELENGQSQSFESNSGRYFLHVYQGSPFQYFSLERKAKKILASQKLKHNRLWLRYLFSPGNRTISDLEFSAEKIAAITEYGNHFTAELDKIDSIKFRVQNIVIKPFENKSANYWFVLTKIRDFHVIANDGSGKVVFDIKKQNKTINESVGRYKDLRLWAHSLFSKA